MNHSKLKFAIALIIAMAAIGGCKHDPTEMPAPDNGGNGGGNGQCDTVNVTYNASVLPIFDQYCLDCHSGAAPQAGIDLTNYSMVALLAENGTLLGSLRHESGYSPMPQGVDKLSDCDIAKIEIWIRDTTFNDPGPGGIPCDPDTVYFQNTILPLLQSSCGIIGCHDPGTASDGIILTDYQNIMNSNIIEPGNPQDSDLYEVLVDDDPDDRMPPPPRSPLTSTQITAVYKWIQQGAQNNYCDEMECDTVNVTFSQTVWPIVQGSCFGCHNGPAPQGGINLDNYNNVVAVANTGQLMGAINHDPGYSPMPQNGAKLSDCKIAQIQKWINDGTPDN
jgi:mono/diheme cytochrome c family protein